MTGSAAVAAVLPADATDQRVADSAFRSLVDSAHYLRELHGSAVDPRLCALLEGAAETLRELAATLTEHTRGQVMHRF